MPGAAPTNHGDWLGLWTDALKPLENHVVMADIFRSAALRIRDDDEREWVNSQAPTS